MGMRKKNRKKKNLMWTGYANQDSIKRIIISGKLKQGKYIE